VLFAGFKFHLDLGMAGMQLGSQILRCRPAGGSTHKQGSMQSLDQGTFAAFIGSANDRYPWSKVQNQVSMAANAGKFTANQPHEAS
jgi:hypothetical protein